MTSVPRLYAMLESGPCRSVMLTAKLLGVKLDIKFVNLIKLEHLKPEFLKMNPEHTVPVLTDDDNFVLSESRAIMVYLAEKYGSGDINSLYPKDIKRRALINQRLHFDNATLYTPIFDYYRVIFYGSKTYDESFMPKIKRGFKYLNIFLDNSKYVAGDNLTLADIAVTSSITTAKAIFEFDTTPYAKVEEWFNFMKANLPHYREIIEINAQNNKVLIDNIQAHNNKVK